MKKTITLSLILTLASTVVAFHNEGSDCARCHLVHMATDNAGVPLWNGAQSITYQAFTDYYSDGYDMQADVGGSPQGSTLLCLSCHDGGTGPHAMAATQGDMSGTHPIEFIYDVALTTVDHELYNPETTNSGVLGSTGTIADDLLTPDFQVMNCVTCHDIHIQGVHGQTVIATDSTTGQTSTLKFDIPHLVNISGIEWSYNSYSGLSKIDPAAYRLNYNVICRTCHNK